MKGAQSTGTWNYKTARLFADQHGVFYMKRGVKNYLTEWEWHERVKADAIHMNCRTRVRVRAGREVIA